MSRSSVTTSFVALAALLIVVGFARPSSPQSSKAAIGPRSNLVQKLYFNIPDIPRHKHTATATDIVRCRVVSVTPRFPRNGVACTAYEMAIEWSLKGVVTSDFTLLLPGAQDGNRQVIADRSPRLQRGEELIVYVSGRAGGSEFGTVALNDSIYRVTRDPLGFDRVSGKGAPGLPIEQFLSEITDEWLRSHATGGK